MTTTGTSKYRGSKEFFLVYAELITAARKRILVGYQTVAQLMGLPLRGQHMGREVGRLLGEISEDEDRLGRPMLSALAVSMAGIPGDGFFKLGRSLGKLSGSTIKAERDFWEKERNAVYEAWK
ncbi:MAG: hypothetical protein A2620_07190 [Acidobacteria bacterium RIFCSPHIGHO2_01_FULL_67_28]|nr:MAG: hypothetical protein A2620_07190 [Acidobacteria bacterium RIFCSPHIGHO2_01_FULL_67_28]